MKTKTLLENDTHCVRTASNPEKVGLWQKCPLGRRRIAMYWKRDAVGQYGYKDYERILATVAVKTI